MSAQSDTLNKTIRQYLATKAAVKSAQEAVDVLEIIIKSEMIGQELSSVECDGKVITLVHSSKRTFDASLLKNLVKPAVFNAVTEQEVKSKLVDAAVTSGRIDKTIVDQITHTTNYTQLRTK